MLENKIELNEKQWNKKEIRRNANKIARGILGYELIMFFIIIGDLIRRIIQFYVSNKKLDLDTQLDKIGSQAINSGTATMVSIFIGFLFLLFYFWKCDYRKEIFHSEEKMTGEAFFMLLTIFMSVQVIFSLLGTGIEAGLNQFGLSILGEIESASGKSNTISMLLYASFIGPITEEIVFRGFVMRGFQKYGKYYAIIMSAVIFGAFHGNLIQGVFAGMVGLVLGYVATKYSIKWSILLHIINNFIFGDLLSYLTTNSNKSMQSMVVYVIEGAFFAGAIVIIILKRNKIKECLKVRKVEKGLMKLTFTSVWLLIFLGFQILQGISGIQRLPVS